VKTPLPQFINIIKARENYCKEFIIGQVSEAVTQLVFSLLFGSVSVHNLWRRFMLGHISKLAKSASDNIILYVTSIFLDAFAEL